jgi:hypothetical protein
MEPLPGFPIIDQGLWMTHVPHLMLTRMTDKLTQRAFERYCEAWQRAIDARPNQARVVAAYDLPSWPGLNAERRSQWARMLKSRERKLRETTAAMTLCSPSALVRGGMTAIFWLAPPPYPHKVVETMDQAFDMAAEHQPALWPADCKNLYSALLGSAQSA